ncbi:MAG TPA: hypothetical protein VGU02_16200 [Gaiellaceae bacterium]|nr:hypothetical protein [Gaiellaceae bacterium]
MRFRLALGAVIVVALSAVAATGVASAADNYTCSGGNWTGDPTTSSFTSIPSGNYASITVKGVCNIALGATINVTGNIDVAAGAVLDAQSAPATITVGRNVTAAKGSVLGLGCQPSNAIGQFAGVPCARSDDPNAQTVITVKGNITASRADTVFIRKVTVNGNVSLNRGGGDIPWSIKGNTIGEDLTITDVSADWLGVQFNTIGGSATLFDITALDPGDPGRTVAVVENTVQKNLNCHKLRPGVSPGFFPGETNHVGGKATGQCAAISVPL